MQHQLVIRRAGCRQDVAVARRSNADGRAGQASDVRLNDPRVSRIHVRLQVDQGTVVVQDAGSSSGTLVYGGPIEQHTYPDADQRQARQVVRPDTGQGVGRNARPLNPWPKAALWEASSHDSRYETSDQSVASSEAAQSKSVAAVYLERCVHFRLGMNTLRNSRWMDREMYRGLNNGSFVAADGEVELLRPAPTLSLRQSPCQSNAKRRRFRSLFGNRSISEQMLVSDGRAAGTCGNDKRAECVAFRDSLERRKSLLN